MSGNKIVKTPIVYYGGKLSIIQHLLDMVPVHEVYTETFFGGGTLFWAKAPAKNETINDRLDIVVNFYRVLKLKYKPLKRLIDATCYSRSEHQKAYRIFSDKRYSDVQRAWAFWMRANFSFSKKLDGGIQYSNHMCSVHPEVMRNKKIEFNELLARRIEGAYIENNDALTVLQSRNVKSAFHYLDPPYFHGTKTEPADQGHYKKHFAKDNYEQLLNFLANDCKGKFLLSNYNSDMLTDYIKKHGWYKKEITHRIAAPRKSGKAKVEILVSNYSTPCGTLKLF